MNLIVDKKSKRVKAYSENPIESPVHEHEKYNFTKSEMKKVKQGYLMFYRRGKIEFVKPPTLEKHEQVKYLKKKINEATKIKELKEIMLKLVE